MIFMTTMVGVCVTNQYANESARENEADFATSVNIQEDVLRSKMASCPIFVHFLKALFTVKLQIIQNIFKFCMKIFSMFMRTRKQAYDTKTNV